MDITFDTKIAVPPLVHRYEKGEWILLYDPRNHSVVRANEQGLAIIETFLLHPRLGDAVDAVARSYGMRFEEVAPSMLQFTFDLVNVGFLHIEEYRPRKVQYRPLDPPDNIYIQNTERCNLSCVYCYNLEERAYFVKEHPEMSTEQLKWAIDQIADFGITQVNFCGGEATLRDDLLEVATYARSRGRIVTLVTNGQKDTDEFTTEAARLFDCIWVSFDSHQKELMERHRGKGSYEPALNSLRKLARVPGKRAQLVVSAVISDQNWREMGELKRFCLEDLGVDRFRATSYCSGCASSTEVHWPLQPPPFVKDENAPMPGEIALSDFSDLLDFELQLTFDRNRMTMKPMAERRNHCGVGKGELAMVSNGDIFPCQLLCKPQFLAGNIFDQPLPEIFYGSEVLKRVRDLTVDRLPGCSTCDVKYVCAGGCRANALEMHGSIDSHNDYNCGFYHRLAVDALWHDSMIPVQRITQAREAYVEAKAKLVEQAEGRYSGARPQTPAVTAEVAEAGLENA